MELITTTMLGLDHLENHTSENQTFEASHETSDPIPEPESIPELDAAISNKNTPIEEDSVNNMTTIKMVDVMTTTQSGNDNETDSLFGSNNISDLDLESAPEIDKIMEVESFNATINSTTPMNMTQTTMKPSMSKNSTIVGNATNIRNSTAAKWRKNEGDFSSKSNHFITFFTIFAIFCFST